MSEREDNIHRFGQKLVNLIARARVYGMREEDFLGCFVGFAVAFALKAGRRPDEVPALLQAHITVALAEAQQGNLAPPDPQRQQ